MAQAAMIWTLPTSTSLLLTAREAQLGPSRLFAAPSPSRNDAAGEASAKAMGWASISISRLTSAGAASLDCHVWSSWY